MPEVVRYEMLFSYDDNIRAVFQSKNLSLA